MQRQQDEKVPGAPRGYTERLCAMSIVKHESRKTENRSRKRVGECRKGLLLLPFIGGLFLLWYVLHATVDVVYSDYIRIINSYLPDTLDPTSFFVPDILTRIPINYPLRGINVKIGRASCRERV